MDVFLTSIKKKYCNRLSSHGQEQYPPRYSSEPVKLELVVQERDPTSTCSDSNIVKQPQFIPYSDIFKKEKEQVVKKVLIEGGTGIGKTTFCSSISEDWANEKLFQEFQVLLLLPLQETRIAAISSLAELIETLQETGNLSECIVDSIKKTNGEGVLIVADGWDEFDAPECSRAFLHDLLFGCILNLASIIVTSRPSHSVLLYTKGCFDRFLSIRGFNDCSIKQYIQLEFTDDQQRSNHRHLLETVECNPLIRSMCHLPLNCATLCHLWRTESRKRKLLTTMTELCTKMILNIVLRSIKKADKYGYISHLSIVECLPEELKSSWWDLCELAFRTIQKSQRINLSQFKSSVLIMIGLVEIVNETRFYFLHPVIQQYLAALHVAHHYHSPDTHMQNKLIQSLDLQITMFWRFLFGICGQSNSNLALLEPAILLLSKFDHLKCLICHCAFEAKNSTIDKKAIKALSTPKHFGDPQTTHDCEAILYVIKQMGDLDAEVELNFNGCNFKEQQLHDLTKILTNKHNRIKVKSLDLGNSNLPNMKIADLFRKALTAFQSIEIIFLRNNAIGKKTCPDEAVYTMKALGFLKCLIQLDLSFNRLTIPGLEALHHNVKCGSLAQLEILLLQAAFTLDAKENIGFLKTFAQSLRQNCRKLRKLDISSNDLGEPGSPLVSAVICTLTGLNLLVNEEYQSEVDKNFVRIMVGLVKREEKIDYTVLHGVIVGPGRSGKNSLMDRLLGKDPPDPNTISSSTGVIDSVIKVEVKKLCTMAAAATNLEWKRLEYDEEALELMMITVITHIASLSEDGIKLEPIPDMIIDEPVHFASAVVLVENESENDGESETDSEVESESESEIDVGKKKIVSEVAKGAISYAHYETKESSLYSKEFSLREGPMDIFNRAVELRHRMRTVRERLESSWSLYLTNTGGQLEFQELLPLLVCGPSVFFVTIPLNICLHRCYTVRYQYPNGTEKTYMSSFILMDEILQTLSTIAALDCTGPQLEEISYKPIKPKVFFIGTHKDLLPESSADDIIKEIDRQLQHSIKQTSLYEQDSIEFAEGNNQLMFTVNNLDKGDCDFQKIRSALQRMVDRRKEFTILCPCSWLVFSLVLRAKHKSSQVLSYNECFTVAQSCGISSRIQLNKALLFIHHRLGLVRYFPIEELNDRVIIDPQILFDTITKLIVETFTSDHASARETEEFQQRGLFSIEVMRTISLKNYSDSQLPFEWILKLLNHLGVAILFKDQNGEQKCFFPSVLCHAPKQQGSNASNCSIKPPPPISIAFKGGFCPRAIPGTLIKSLMNNELKSSISWKLHQKRVFRNQVSFSVGPADIILKILPTHIEVCFDPASATADQNLSRREVNITCEEAYKQIRRIMNDVVLKFRDCDYYFAFNCTLPECKERPHPAKIDWDTNKLECRIMDRKSHLPDGYKLWTQIGSYQQVLGDQVLDFNNEAFRHLGQVADKMSEWEGSIAGQLDLTPADVAAINMRYPKRLKLQTREALKKWKQMQGPNATYNNLIKVFEQAGHKDYAEIVKDLLMKDVQIDTNRNTINQTPPPPSEQPLPQLPVFPSESEQLLESSSYAAAARVKLVEEDYQLEHDPGSNRLKVKEVHTCCVDDTSSLSQSSENDEASYMELEHYGTMEFYDDDKMSEQSEAENAIPMQHTADLYDQSISSSLESAQECWLNSNTAHQNALKQQTNEDDTEAQSESELKGEALADNKLSGSMDSKHALLKQSDLEHEAPSDNKQFSSLVSVDASLKRSELEDGEPTTKRRCCSNLDSALSIRTKEITPFKRKRKHSIKHDPGSNRLKVKEVHTCCVDDTSSLSQSSENDEASYTKMEHYGTMEFYDDDKISEQSEAESAIPMQHTADLYDQSISSSLESAQECWLNSNTAHQNALKQQTNEDDAEAQSESELKGEALADNKLSESMENALKQQTNEDDTEAQSESELKGEALADNKLSGSMDSKHALLKQSDLEHEAPSDNKQFSSLVSVDASLKRSELEDGEPTITAKRRCCSDLDSAPNIHTKEITPFTRKRKYSINEGIEEKDVEEHSSDSETSSSRSLTQPSGLHRPEEQHISSGEESIIEEVNIHQQVATKMRALTELDARDSFGRLVALVASKLSDKQSRNELNIQHFYLYLESIFAPKALPKADDVLEIFRDINTQELWDYCQYRTLECIANRYLPKDKEVSSAIGDHREMVNNYLATQCIANYIEEKLDTELRQLTPTFHGRRTNRKYYETISLRLQDVSIRLKTLKYIRDLWGKIKREFHLSDCNALLDHIYNGSSRVADSELLVGASRSNNLESVKYIIDNAKNLDINVEEPDRHAWTALMWGTNKDNLEMVELLLANNADPNVCDKVNHWSPVMLATRQGNLKMVKLLLDYGADPNAQSSIGENSVSLAVCEHHTEIAMLLVHRGADVNIIEENGNSPLTHACVENDMELVKLFCDYHANMNHQGKRGWSPLMEAACRGFKDIVEELAKRGADLNMRTEAGESAIHAATVKGHVGVVRVLANYGADLNMPNRDGLTSLMVAADKGYQSIVEALLEGGVDVNYKHQTTGWPAIFFTAKNCRVGILRELLARGAKTEFETGLKLVDVAYFFKRGAIEEEIRKKPQQVHPHQHEVPGLEAGAVGIELTSFTKKDITVGESEEQQRTQTEESQPVESTTHSETGQEQSEQLDESEVGTKNVSQPKIAHVGKQESVDQLKVTTSTDEKLMKVTEFAESTTAAESGGEVETKSTDKISPDVIEEKKDEAETKGQAEEPQPQQEKEQQKASTETQPHRVEDIRSTTKPEGVPGDSQPAQSNQDIAEIVKFHELIFQAMDQRMDIENVPGDSKLAQSNQNIAEIAKVYELLFQAMDQRMNIENVKKSRKGISDVAPI